MNGQSATGSRTMQGAPKRKTAVLPYGIVLVSSHLVGTALGTKIKGLGSTDQSTTTCLAMVQSLSAEKVNPMSQKHENMNPVRAPKPNMRKLRQQRLFELALETENVLPLAEDG
eukprot:5398499-Amphidinium_carterae.5